MAVLFPKYEPNKKGFLPLQNAKKSIFNIQYAKMVLENQLEELLNIYYTGLEVSFDKTELLCKIFVYNPFPKDLDEALRVVKKEKVTALCKETFSWYCRFNLKVLIIWTRKDTVTHPKYYFRLLLKRCKGKTNAFNVLSKLEKINLHPAVKGLLIRIKGKRTNRKEKKVLLLGNPCRHSNEKELLVCRNYIIKTPAGTLGVKIIVAKNKTV